MVYPIALIEGRGGGIIALTAFDEDNPIEYSNLQELNLNIEEDFLRKLIVFINNNKKLPKIPDPTSLFQSYEGVVDVYSIEVDMYELDKLTDAKLMPSSLTAVNNFKGNFATVVSDKAKNITDLIMRNKDPQDMTNKERVITLILFAVVFIITVLLITGIKILLT